MARKFTTEGRLAHVYARMGQVSEDLAEAVLDGEIELTSDQVSQLTLTVSDPTLRILGTRLFDAPVAEGKAGSSLNYADLKFEVAAVEIASASGTPALKVTARSQGAQKLRRGRLPTSTPKPPPIRHVAKDQVMTPMGPVWQTFVDYTPAADPAGPVDGSDGRNVSPTDYMRVQAKRVGLNFVGQTSALRDQIAPVVGTPGNPSQTDQQQKSESMWDVGQRLAKELGYVCFEAAGTLYFGQPTWLADRAHSVTVTWGASPGVLDIPACRRTGDDPTARSTSTVDLQVDPVIGDTLHPGMGLKLKGVPTFEGTYLITKVTIPLDDSSAVSVSAVIPENPDPEPGDQAVPTGGQVWDGFTADVAGLGTVIQLPSGKYGDETLVGEQCYNASIIYRVGRQDGASQNDKIMAIMCSMQEARLYVDAPGGQDHDSTGIFEQRPSQGWGTVEQIRNPVYASHKFYQALFRQPNRLGRPRWQVVADVQRPAAQYRNLYANWETMATAVVRTLDAAYDAPAGSGAGGTGADKSAEKFVQIALGQMGDPYSHTEARLDDANPSTFDCSELVEWASFRAGVKFVDGAMNQLAFCKRHGTTIPLEQAIRTRGALLFNSSGSGDAHVEISLGNYERQTFGAVGHGNGVTTWPFERQTFKWDEAALIPGMTYGSPYNPYAGSHRIGDKPNER